MAFSPGSAEGEALLLLAQEIMRRIYAEEDAAVVRQWLMGRLAAATPKQILSTLAWGDTFGYYDKLLVERAERSLLPPDKRREFIWPWASWRALMDAPDEGMLLMIAAGPGVGKTIAVEMIMEGNAKAGAFGLLFHLELGPKTMMDRRAVRQVQGQVLRRDFKRGLLNDDQMARLSEDISQHPDASDGLNWIALSQQARALLDEANARMQDWPGGIDYVHSPGWTVDQIVEYTEGEYERRKGTDQPISFVAVDYLGKVAASARQLKLFGMNQFAREADTVETLKNLAERLGIPIVVLDQLSKSGRQTDLADIDGTHVRGAGEKTERVNVGVVLNLERDANGEPTDFLQAKVFKNTMGSEGVIQMIRKPEMFTIRDMEIERVPLTY